MAVVGRCCSYSVVGCIDGWAVVGGEVEGTDCVEDENILAAVVVAGNHLDC